MQSAKLTEADAAECSTESPPLAASTDSIVLGKHVSQDCYELPEWFLKHNIKISYNNIPKETVVDVYTTRNDSLSSPPSEIGASSAATRQDGDESEDSYRLKYKTLAPEKLVELKEMIYAGLFCRDKHGKFPKATGVVLVKSPMKRDTGILNDAILQSASEVGARVMSIDDDDIDDLALEFNNQESLQTRTDVDDEDSVPIRYMNKSDRTRVLAIKYFGTQEEFDKAHAKSMSTIFDGENLMNAISDNSTSVGRSFSWDQIPPLVIHLRPVTHYQGLSLYPCIKNMQKAMQERRDMGRQVVMVVSYYEPDESGAIKIATKKWPGKPSFTVELPSAPLLSQSDHLRPGHFYAKSNLRNLRRRLREFEVPGLSKELLDPHADWVRAGFGSAFLSVGKSRWTSEVLDRLERRLLAQCRNTALEPANIRNVMVTMGLCDDPGVAKTRTVAKSGTKKNIVDILKLLESCTEEETMLLDSGCLINRDQLDTTYDDVIIDQETKSSVKLLVSKFKMDKKRFAPSILLDQIRLKGALLYGPPGTGKTHLTRAIAKDSGSSMLAVDAATLTSKWVGDTEKMIKAAFTLAGKLSPCVLFLDEADSLFRRRKSGDHRHERAALNQLLQELDGLSKNDNSPFVVVATNMPMDLDDACLRRLPEKVYLGLPDLQARERILRLFLKEDELDSFDISELARKTDGYSGSDLRSLCAQAALKWKLEQLNSIETELPDEQSSKKTIKLFLGDRHFEAALKKTKPSVSKQVLADLAEFTNRFNPEAAGIGQDSYSHGTMYI